MVHKLFHDDGFLLCEKYAPRTLDDLILPSHVHEKVSNIIETGNIPNLILHGTQGIGKTQTIKVLCKTLDVDYLYINGSNEGRILDNIREKIEPFATKKGISYNKRKVVIFDEVDNTTQNVMLQLRGLIEAVQSNCSFCFTCNHFNKVHEAIVSRTTPIKYFYQPTERKDIIVKFYKRISNILDEENIGYEKEILLKLIGKHFGDWRQIFNIIQPYVGTENSLDSSVLGESDDKAILTLINHLKNKKFDESRKWLAQDNPYPHNDLFTLLRDNIDKYVMNESKPIFIVLLSKYDYQLRFGTDPQIQILAMFTEIMSSCKFK